MTIDETATIPRVVMLSQKKPPYEPKHSTNFYGMHIITVTYKELALSQPPEVPALFFDFRNFYTKGNGRAIQFVQESQHRNKGWMRLVDGDHIITVSLHGRQSEIVFKFRSGDNELETAVNNYITRLESNVG